MPDRQELEALFLANLGVVDKLLASLARRHGLGTDDADEFGAWAKLRFVEGDYAILAKFRGESSLTTYLAVVLATLFREYRVAEWGRWRPSAAALRKGSLAVRLETMVHRDGVTLAQAGETLRSAGVTTQSDRELAAVLAELPRRTPLRPVQSGALPDVVPDASRADERVDAEEAEREQSAVGAVLSSALAALDSDDRLVLQLRFAEGLSVADVARALAIPQKPLYRRLERSLKVLRVALEQAGFSRSSVEAFGEAFPWSGEIFQDGVPL